MVYYATKTARTGKRSIDTMPLHDLTCQLRKAQYKPAILGMLNTACGWLSRFAAKRKAVKIRKIIIDT